MDAMTHEWRQAVGEMIKLLLTDRRNAKIAADPWWRAASNMTTGWRLRLSQRPSPPKTRKPRRDWMTFARLAVNLENSKAAHTALPKWHRWAKARAPKPFRYVRKAERQW